MPRTPMIDRYPGRAELRNQPRTPLTHEGVPDTGGMFGRKENVDPVKRETRSRGDPHALEAEVLRPSGVLITASTARLVPPDLAGGAVITVGGAVCVVGCQVVCIYVGVFWAWWGEVPSVGTG